MLRGLIFVGVLGLAIAEDKLVIDKISRKTKVSEKTKDVVEQIEMCFTGGDTYDHYHLNIIPDLEAAIGEQYNGDSKDVNVGLTSKCVTFEGDIKKVGTTKAEFFFTGQSSSDATVDFGTAIINLPDFLDTLTAHWVEEKSLRIKEGDVKDFKIGDVGCSKGVGGEPCYFVDIKSPAKHKPTLQLCKSKKEELPNIKDITICDLTQKDAPVIAPASPDILSTLTLQYDKAGTAQKIITVRSDSFTSEIVVYIETTIIKVCGTPSLECVIPYIQADQDVSVLVVGINTDPVDSKVHTITDLNLMSNALSTTLLEIRWTHKSDVTDDKYYAVRDVGTATGLVKEFTGTIVTCHNPDNESGFHCFAYFTGLEAENSYDVTVQPGDGGLNNVDTNKVTLAGTPMTSAFNRKDNMIQINTVDITWQKSLSSFVTDICFNGDLTADLSQYQVIITGNHGQWHKVSGASVTRDMKTCFENVVLDAHKFHLDDPLFITVVKRAENMVDVLASGERKVHFVDTTAPLFIEKIHQVMDHHRQEVLTKLALTHSHHLEGLSSLDIHVHHDKTHHQVEGIRLPRSSLLAPHELTFNIDLPDFIRKQAKVLLIGRNAHGTVVTAQKINNI